MNELQEIAQKELIQLRRVNAGCTKAKNLPRISIAYIDFNGNFVGAAVHFCPKEHAHYCTFTTIQIATLQARGFFLWR
jgi:hypothetical protein